MVKFGNLAGRKPYLVSVRGITRGGLTGDFYLREFSRRGFIKACPWVSAACNPHGLMHKCPARKRIPNRAAKTGSRPAKRLDLRRVVVGLVLEQ